MRQDLEQCVPEVVEGEEQLPPGGMRGVKVSSKPATCAPDEAEETQQSPMKKEPTLVQEPVELFPTREGGGGGRSGGGAEAGRGADGYPSLGMTPEMAKNEIQWKIEEQVKKMLGALTTNDVDSFAREVQVLLSILSGHRSAQKLMSFPASDGPLWPVLSCLLAEGARREEGKEKSIVVAMRALAGVLSVSVCQLLQQVVEKVATDVCEQPFFSEQTKHLFCSFIGKLFIDASYSQNNDYAAVMGHIVRHFLECWSKCPVECQEEDLLARVECFGFLCEQIGPSIDVTNRGTLEDYFRGVVREHILSTQLPRSVCGCLLDLSLKRASGWSDDKTRKKPPPPPSSLFSQDTPTHTASGHPVVPVEVFSGRSGTVDGSTNGTRPAAPSSSFNQPPQTTHHYPSQPTPPTAVTIPPYNAHQEPGHHGGVPGIQPIRQTPGPQHSMTFTAVHQMLTSLGLPHLLTCFNTAMISDSVLECSNLETVRRGLKDAGLQLGEATAVLDYLEKRRRTPSSLTPSSMTPSSMTPSSMTPSSMTPYSMTPYSMTPYSSHRHHFYTSLLSTPATPASPYTNPTSQPSTPQHHQQYCHPPPPAPMTSQCSHPLPSPMTDHPPPAPPQLQHYPPQATSQPQHQTAPTQQYRTPATQPPSFFSLPPQPQQYPSNSQPPSSQQFPQPSHPPPPQYTPPQQPQPPSFFSLPPQPQQYPSNSQEREQREEAHRPCIRP